MSDPAFGHWNNGWASPHDHGEIPFFAYTDSGELEALADPPPSVVPLDEYPASRHAPPPKRKVARNPPKPVRRPRTRKPKVEVKAEDLRTAVNQAPLDACAEFIERVVAGVAVTYSRGAVAEAVADLRALSAMGRRPSV